MSKNMWGGTSKNGNPYGNNKAEAERAKAQEREYARKQAELHKKKDYQDREAARKAAAADAKKNNGKW